MNIKKSASPKKKQQQKLLIGTDIVSLLLYNYWCSIFFFFSSRRRHTRSLRDWSSDVCSSDLLDEIRSERDGFLEERLRVLEHVALEVHQSKIEVRVQRCLLVVVETDRARQMLDRLVPNLLLERSEEHTSELQSRRDIVCRLLL